MADEIEYRIHGSDMQMVEIALDPGEGVICEAGAMVFTSGNIEMQTTILGGVIGGLKRKITGETFFMTSFYNRGRGKEYVAFAAPYPGRIIPIHLGRIGGEILCQKRSFLCAADGTKLELAMKLRAGLLGGEGFILQRLIGNSLAFIHAGGTILGKQLAFGEEMKIDTGCLVAFSPTVTYDIRFVGGVRNALFGKEGFFLANLQGPGMVFVQSLPLSRLADSIFATKRRYFDKKQLSKEGERITLTGQLNS